MKLFYQVSLHPQNVVLVLPIWVFLMLDFHKGNPTSCILSKARFFHRAVCLWVILVGSQSPFISPDIMCFIMWLQMKYLINICHFSALRKMLLHFLYIIEYSKSWIWYVALFIRWMLSFLSTMFKIFSTSLTLLLLDLFQSHLMFWSLQLRIANFKITHEKFFVTV